MPPGGRKDSVRFPGFDRRLQGCCSIVLAEYKVNRSSRRCCVEDRPLRDGEPYYSVVIESGDDWVRRDYSASAWDSPPAGTLGWWKCRMPAAGQRKMVLAPDPVLVETLRQMSEDPARGPLAYLLALTLMRRRLVRIIPSEPAIEAAGTGSSRGPSSTAGTGSSTGTAALAGQEQLIRLQVLADETEIEVLPYRITRAQTEPLAEALQELLYVEAVE